VNDRDNLQNITLQGYAGILRECSVCHGYNPTGPGPHGLLASVPYNRLLQNILISSGQSECFDATHTITVAGSSTTFNLQSGGETTLIAGHSILLLPGTFIQSGGRLMGKITTNGTYCSSEPSTEGIPGSKLQIPLKNKH